MTRDAHPLRSTDPTSKRTIRSVGQGLRLLVFTTIAVGSSLAVWHATADAPGTQRVEVEEAPPSPEVPKAAPTYECRRPAIPVDPSEGCEHGEYPDCTWRIVEPERASHLYRIWRNTREEHLRGRPGLVALVLTAAKEYSRRYPGEQLVIGDLDAPGPRHMTHRKGQDVDLYLPGAMIAENIGMGHYPSNYLYKAPLGQHMRRARVLELAKILTTCAAGRIRFYYNDPGVNERFKRWFRNQDFRSPFGEAMRYHNDLHRFHYHVTVDEELEPLPVVDE
ncbi:MAG: hypothetical protein AAGF12_31260 [Myxococcota bacterium]